MLWELIKLEVRGKSIECSTQKNRRLRQKEKELEVERSSLGENIKMGKNKERQQALIKELNIEKRTLEETRQPRINGMMKRAEA